VAGLNLVSATVIAAKYCLDHVLGQGEHAASIPSRGGRVPGGAVSGAVVLGIVTRLSEPS
jgi:hypothetical protein